MRPASLLTALLLWLPLLLLPAQPRPCVAPVEPAHRAYLAGDVATLRNRLPGLQKTPPRSPATRFYTAYWAYATSADDQAALRAYSAIIRDSPDFADAYHGRSALFSIKGLDERAIADATKAIELAGADVPGPYYTSRATYNFHADNLPAAQADFKAAITRSPAAADNYRGLVNTALKAGTPTEAETVLREALAGPQAGSAPGRLADAALMQALAVPGFAAASRAPR